MIVWNLLNWSYFSDEKLSTAIQNLNNICLDNGYLLVVENRNSEQGGLSEKRNEDFHLVERIGSSSDIHDLIILTPRKSNGNTLAVCFSELATFSAQVRNQLCAWKALRDREI